MPEGVRVVERAGAVFAAHRLPEQTGGVHNGAIDDGTRNITKQPNSGLYDAHGHGFICKRRERESLEGSK